MESHNPFQGHNPNGLRTSGKPYLLQVLPPSKNTTLGTKPLTRGPWGTFNSQSMVPPIRVLEIFVSFLPLWLSHHPISAHQQKWSLQQEWMRSCESSIQTSWGILFYSYLTSYLSVQGSTWATILGEPQTFPHLSHSMLPVPAVVTSSLFLNRSGMFLPRLFNLLSLLSSITFPQIFIHILPFLFMLCWWQLVLEAFMTILSK